MMGPMKVLAADPAKQDFERRVLLYSVVWIAVVAVVIFTHAFARWGDAGHLALGLGLALPLWILPFLVERERPLSERYATRFTVWVGLFSLLQCYFGSAVFFDVMGMEYHFPVTWIVNRTPLFLYFLTVAYFSTYYVAMSLAWRAFRTAWPSAPAPLRLVVLCALGAAVAFAETSSMANPLLRDWFRYRDMTFALTWGSLIYGTVFVATLPLVFRIDEDAARPRPLLRALAVEVLAVTMVVLCVDEVYLALLSSPARS
jgi:cycloeucalenol cycloisomerase